MGREDPPEQGASPLPPWCTPGAADRPSGLEEVPLEDLVAETIGRIRAAGALAGSQCAIDRVQDLKDILETLLEVDENRFSRTRYKGLFFDFHLGVEPRPPLRGATIVDIGSGPRNPAGLGFLFLMLGAKRCYLIEPDTIWNLARATRALAELAASMLLDPGAIVGDFPVTPKEILHNIGSFDLAALGRGDPSGIDRDRLILRRTDADAMPLEEGEADLVISQAVWQHVERIEESMAETARVTRQGGLGIHGIDTTDHRRYEDRTCHPLEYLKLDTQEDYLRLAGGQDKQVVFSQNRLRPCQFRECFQRHGFEVLQFRDWGRIPVSEKLRAQFVEPFRSMPLTDLEPAGGQFLVRKK